MYLLCFVLFVLCFFIVSFMYNYIYSYLFCLYWSKDYCHRVTTELQLVIMIIIIIIIIIMIIIIIIKSILPNGRSLPVILVKLCLCISRKPCHAPSRLRSVQRYIMWFFLTFCCRAWGEKTEHQLDIRRLTATGVFSLWRDVCREESGGLV